MMILTRPSVTPYLTKTLASLRVPVVEVEPMTIPMRPALEVLTPEQFQAMGSALSKLPLLTSFENGLSVIYSAIPDDPRVKATQIFKDKAAFRRALAARFPNFFFQEHTAAEIDEVDPSSLPFPVIVKPAVGISSIGVARVANAEEWKAAIKYLKEDLAKYQANYRESVVEGAAILIEEFIEGREFAVDGYFNEQGEPVILNILEHLFSDAGDMGDRFYYTRRSIVRMFSPGITQFLKELGAAFELALFPFHLEVRITPDGRIVPIEVNPFRFAGLGTTELVEYAYDINVYRCFFEQKKPDWDRILSNPDDSAYYFSCADVPTDLFRKSGLKINDRAFFNEMSEVLEYRILNENETSTFAIVFGRTASDEEAQKLLRMDLRRFLT